MKLKLILLSLGGILILIFALWNYRTDRPNFDTLDSLLRSENWEEADRETSRVITSLATAGESQFKKHIRVWVGEPPVDTLSQIECNDLLTLDQLWVKNSKGRFGFSVQQKIWATFYDGKTPPNSYEIDYLLSRYQLFTTKLGWRNSEGYYKSHKSLDYSLNAPEGQLPSSRWLLEGLSPSKPNSDRGLRVHYLLKRIGNCYSAGNQMTL